MRISTLLMVGALAIAGQGCMSGMHSSNGGKTFTYDCSGPGKGWGDCSAKADAQCGVRSYAIVSQSGDAQEKSPGGNTEMKRTLVISCK